MEIEINFRLDENGRTASTQEQQQQNEDPLKDGREEEDTSGNGTDSTIPHIDYSYQVTMTNLASSSGKMDDETTQTQTRQAQHQQWLDELLFDCEISDSGLMPRTFWVPAQGFTPRCTLEEFALNVFHHHVPKDFTYDVAKSGAEWWCQIRPSPEKTGRYAMHCSQTTKNNDDGNDNDDSSPEQDPFAQGISMHVDKDEDLRILTGGTTYIHPHLSTVTYLTNLGSPTMIMNCRVHPLEGTWIVPDETMEGFVSWPALGKHISFDGRYLHAAPCDLMEEGTFEKQINFTPIENDPKHNKVLGRRHRRITFLVNIWLNHHPFDVHPFPDTMIDKMSGNDKQERHHLLFSSDSSRGTSSGPIATHTRSVSVSTTIALEQKDRSDKCDHRYDEYTTTKFVWPLGDQSSNERLEIQIPLDSLRREASIGGNVSIQWKGTKEDVPFRLYCDQCSEQPDGQDGIENGVDNNASEDPVEEEEGTTTDKEEQHQGRVKRSHLAG
ncbi:hypothetical protein IV203_006507 [Nitzschia inconspicua]|uniref:Uncharacterized protein n=1 Tax=Nitzschia inconspicua TaxID=303405 RepID=A0A9K3P9F8_9STRA|nr:hypothetical protein IV203_006626 [Nitzschia inconspicua]KAG7340103.1 hypothetical protein IV203_006507 [Nitzschia inconspicua]